MYSAAAKRFGWVLLAGIAIGCGAAPGGTTGGDEDEGDSYETGASSSSTGAGATGTGAGTTTGSSTTGTTTGAGAGDTGTTTGAGGGDIHTGSSSSGGVTTGSGAGGTTSTGSGGAGGGSVNTDCCVPSQSPGCADNTLQACVCALDSYCCDNAWDAICVSEAQQNCNACPNAQCYDVGQGEPNDSEGTALNLTGQPITDCDYTGGAVNGTIDSPSDEDWYYYAATDELACFVNPERSLTTTNGGVQLCKYFECYQGPTQVNCPIGTTADTSPDGRDGCCATYGFNVDIDCTDTSSDDAWVYLRVSAPGAPSNVCTHYAVDYHY
jgi:hypothetical protein